MGKKVRIGVVGGSFGHHFYWHEHPDCIVQAVSDLRPEGREALKQAYKCDNAYDCLDDMLRDRNVDAVAIFSGAPWHVEHSVAALRAGKHVISAVPAAMTLDECAQLRDAVEQTGLAYMMAETSYYNQSAISARRFYNEGQFGHIFYTESEYHHPGLDVLCHDEHGNRTWRHGLPPMHYPTHCTAFLVGVTGERLTEVTCIGWGDSDNPILQDNAYGNPYSCETAFFKTDRGNSMRVAVYWEGAEGGCERAQWYGDKMSFFMKHPNGLGPIIRRAGADSETEQYDQPEHWLTDMVPDTMRHGGGHDGGETFLTHEFIDALVNDRRPAIDIYEALAYTAPGIVAHQSALKGGEQLKIPSFDR